MAKLNRERKLVERRAAKQAKKDARKQAAALEAAGPTDEEPHAEDAGPIEDAPA